MAELNLPESVNPAQALRVVRLIWAGTLVMPIVIAGVIIALVRADPPGADAALRQLVFVIAVGMLVVLTPLGLFARNQMYKAHWRGLAVSPNGYAKGNIILFSMLEGVSFVALVMMLMVGLHPGLLGVASVSLLVHLANFPNGKPMQPREPSLPEPEKL